MIVFLVCFLVHFVSVVTARVLVSVVTARVFVPLRSVPPEDGTSSCRRM